MGHGHALLPFFWKLLGLLLPLVVSSAASFPPGARTSPPGSPPGSPSLPGGGPPTSSLSSESTLSSTSQISSGTGPTFIGSSTLSSSISTSPATTQPSRLHSTSQTTDSAASIPTAVQSVPTTASTPFSGPSLAPSPTDTLVVPDPSNSGPAGSNTDTALEVPPSTTAVIAASAKPSNKTPIIAGVVVPILFITLCAGVFVLYKRRQRARDRREWERTHEAIADAVRQVGGPATGGAMSPYSSGVWSHLDLPARGTGVGYAVHDGSGDTMTDPFVDKAVGHQPAEYAARPAFAAPHSPGFGAPQSPHYVDEPESRPASSMESASSIQNHDDSAHTSHAHQGL